ncbi:MAG: tetratricopeptide repeat protein [Pseudomonadota bacterium]
MDWNSWGPPLMATGIGLVAGLALVWKARGGGDEAEEAQALAAHKEALLRRLRELDLERPKLHEAEWQEERAALIKQAAEALRRLDALDAKGPARSAGLLMPASLLGALTLLGTAVLVWPSGGDEQIADLQQQPTPNPHAMATAAGAGLPEDLDQLNSMAYAALLEGQLSTAMAVIEKARALAPDDPTVRTNLDIMRMNVGMVDKALADLQQVVTAHPQEPRPTLWLAYAHGQKGQDSEARVLLARVIELAPGSEDAQQAMAWLQELDVEPGQAAP